MGERAGIRWGHLDGTCGHDATSLLRSTCGDGADSGDCAGHSQRVLSSHESPRSVIMTMLLFGSERKRHEIEKYLQARGVFGSGPAYQYMQRVCLVAGEKAKRQGFHDRVYGSWELYAAGVGHLMEETAQLIQSVNVEVQESKRILRELSMEIKAVGDIVGPMLLGQVKSVRDARMTTVNELKESLAQFREVRKFFLESDYEREMQRLERFIAACRELQQLKASGVLDAVSDVVIRLAVQETVK